MPTMDMDIDYNTGGSGGYAGLTAGGTGKDYGKSGGDDISELLGGKGAEMRKVHRGITSPSHRSGQGWIKGLDGKPGMAELQGAGWLSAPGTSMGQGYTLQDVTNPVDDAYWNQDMFRDKYYDPYLKEAIMEPLSSLGGPQIGGGYSYGSPQEGTDFQQVTYQGAEGDVTGIIAAPEGSTPQFDIDRLGDALAGAEEDYNELVGKLTWEEGGELYDESRKALDEAELQAKMTRSQLMSGKPEQYESARAVQARSGMAYSAPATSAETSLQDESSAAMDDPAQTIRKARESFSKAEKDAEEMLEIATGDYESAQQEYYTGMMSIGGDAMGGGSAYSNVENILSSLEQAHTGMGAGPKALGGVASKDRKNAITDAGMYREGMETPGISQMRNWMESSTGPRAFAAQMKSVMQGAYYDVGSETEGGE